MSFLINVFDQKKLHLLHDPVISPKIIVFKKKEAIDSKYNNKKIIIAIGRLTKQKNFTFLLHCFALIKKKHPDYHLLILGSGEEENKLKKIIHNLKISNAVDLLGFEENPYKYLSKAECFILSSLWEDPGFVLAEAAIMNTNIISSDCPNGPTEIICDKDFLFTNGSSDDLLKKFDKYKNKTNKELFSQQLNVKKRTRSYTSFQHFKQLTLILN